MKKVILISVLAIIVYACNACKKEMGVPSPVDPNSNELPANPDIVFHKINDTIARINSGTTEYPVDVTRDGIVDFDVSITITDTRNFSILITGINGNKIADSTDNIVKVLHPSRTINSELNIWSNSGYFIKVKNGNATGINTFSDFFAGIYLNVHGTMHYGWIQLKLPLVRSNAHTIIIETCGFENQEKTALKAGVRTDF